MTTKTKTKTKRADLDLSALTLMYQLSTDPALFAERLCCESDTDRAARQAAAADIIDDGLAAIANAGPNEAAQLVHARVEAHAVEVAAQVEVWEEQIRGAAA